ncbi:MAG: hypothetical protein EOO61_02470 [Hymenobacter sp.]|nr:MAG: hypothetical protein EOO61_02470 [Hymenobacter sp.]
MPKIPLSLSNIYSYRKLSGCHGLGPRDKSRDRSATVSANRGKPTPSRAKRYSKLFKALNDQARLQILEMLGLHNALFAHARLIQKLGPPLREAAKDYGFVYVLPIFYPDVQG